LIERRPRARGTCARLRLVEVEGYHHVAGAAAHVPDLAGERVGQLALDEQVPLLRELRPQVLGEDPIERAGAAVHVGSDVGEADGDAARPGRGIEDSAALEIEG